MPTTDRSSTPSVPWRIPSCAARSSTWAWCATSTSTRKGAVVVLIALTVAGCPLRNEITNRVTGAVSPLAGVSSVSLDFTVMTDQEREDLRMKLHGDPSSTAGQGQAHGHAEGRKVPFSEPGSKTRPLLISSGKGGVGKSSVTVNLAVALAAQGYSVGVVDADIYGYSIPRMLGTDRDPVVIDQMLVPPEAYGVRCISIGYFVPEGQAVIWRGPDAAQGARAVPHRRVLGRARLPARRHAARHRRHRPQSLSQYLPRGEVYVVTTPQPAAQKVARLSAAMADKVNLPVKGIIENMSWFTGDDGKRYEIFGQGGGAGAGRRARACRCSVSCRSCRRCARAATTAARSPRSTPTARPRRRSTRSPGASPSS